MSWSGLANNQIVSNANLDNAISTSVFTRRATFTANGLELTKARAQSYVYLNENLASLFAKTNNQLVAKQDLQAATFIACGSGTYGNIVWTANVGEYSTVFFDVGTTSGTLTIDYQVNSGSASLLAVYGTNTLSITGLVSTNGSTTYSYTYNPSVGTILGITFSTRQNPAVTQNFNVRTSCAATTTTTTTAPPTVDIFIDNNNSLDIPITGMTINGVAVTYSSGANFTINAGNNGNFTSTQLGTYTVVITYGSHISGQNITFVDSDNNITCKDLNGSAGSFTIAGATITGGTTIYVTAADGACL